jgi:cell division protein FtsL
MGTTLALKTPEPENVYDDSAIEKCIIIIIIIMFCILAFIIVPVTRTLV